MPPRRTWSLQLLVGEVGAKQEHRSADALQQGGTDVVDRLGLVSDGKGVDWDIEFPIHKPLGNNEHASEDEHQCGQAGEKPADTRQLAPDATPQATGYAVLLLRTLPGQTTVWRRAPWPASSRFGRWPFASKEVAARSYTSLCVAIRPAEDYRWRRPGPQVRQNAAADQQQDDSGWAVDFASYSPAGGAGVARLHDRARQLHLQRNHSICPRLIDP
jgi:hypothetical protein